MVYRIFVVEDNEWYNKLLCHQLALNPDYEIKAFYSAEELLNSLHENPDLITLDYRLPDMNGDELLKKIREFSDQIDVIIISEQEDIETAVNLLQAGAFDYLVKSKDIRNRLLNAVTHSLQHKKLEKRIESLEREVIEKYDFSQSILGNSPAIKRVFEMIGKAIRTNIVVSINGETGTGKELVAKAIHYNSPSKNKPFVAVNVAAIPADLFESELFGHEKGAFTGAAFQRKGKFEEADGGTLFLDEIGEMNLNFQAKLLRAIQEREITRVGSNENICFDCRIIVASHKNLLEEVRAGRFREDLYYRLFGLPILLPPLRDRDNDVLVLAKSFISNFCKENKLELKKLSESAQLKLKSYSWPGNVRELKSVVELASVMSNSEQILPEDILLSSASVISDVLSEELSLKEYNLKILNIFLNKYDQNIKLVAEKLQIGQTTIYRMLKKD